MIAMWTDALRDDNPVYADDAAARAFGRPGVIAPPTMIQAWTMPPLSQMAQNRAIPGYRPYWREATAPPQDSGNPGATAYEILREHGFSNSAATNCRQVYHRELVPGDHTKCVTTLDSISPLKHTAMGDGHFVTNRMEYLDQDDRPVATQLWTVLQFRTPTEDELKAAAAARVGRAGQAGPGQQAAGAEEAPVPGGPLAGAPQAGQRTPDIVIPITPTFVIATAIATHDYYAIHHDTDWARSIGRPDIFTNILTTTGLVGQVMTHWAGPATRLKSIDLRLLVPNYPGDELTLRGKVSAVDGDVVTLEVTGTNAIGTHVRATVVGQVNGE
jgi:acyl dehydratase